MQMRLWAPLGVLRLMDGPTMGVTSDGCFDNVTRQLLTPCRAECAWQGCLEMKVHGTLCLFASVRLCPVPRWVVSRPGREMAIAMRNQIILGMPLLADQVVMEVFRLAPVTLSHEVLM